MKDIVVYLVGQLATEQNDILPTKPENINCILLAPSVRRKEWVWLGTILEVVKGENWAEVNFHGCFGNTIEEIQ